MSAPNARPFPVPPDEQGRLDALASYRATDSALEARLDRIAHVAAELVRVPAAFISFVESDRQCLKARIGFDLRQTPRAGSFCAHTIMSDDVLVVPDATRDARFADSALVTGAPRLRFYAGAPLVTAAGHRLGALCVVDHVRRRISPVQKRALQRLASLAVDELELHRTAVARSAAIGLADSVGMGLLCVDAEGLITFSNHATEQLFGYSRAEMSGRKLDLIIPERLRGAHAAAVARASTGHGSGPDSKLAGKPVEVTARRRDGSEFPAELFLSTWPGRDGIEMGATIQDITERRQRDANLHRLASCDALTGLANRVRFEERLEETTVGRRPATVILLDLDRFKSVNDSFGHTTGDTLLQALAIRLTRCFDQHATIARLGGDGFAVLLPDADLAAAASAAAQLREAVAQPFSAGGHMLHLGASIGVACGPDHGGDADALLASADLALHRVKSEGGGAVRMFDAAMGDELAGQRALHDDLLRAVEAGEFVLHYQPQVMLEDGQVFGAEALLRWDHAERGLLLPGAFLSSLETHALAPRVGWWILDQACRQAAAWRESGLPAIRVGVNLFAAQLRSGDLVAKVDEALARHGLPPCALEIEITETIVLQQDDGALAPLRELYERGIGIAFDDFGTGYASLSMLKRFPLTRLKIDRSFVRDLLTVSHDAAIVTAVLAMGRGLGLEVIAEGVETPDQAARLRAMGCEAAQGFLYGRAVPAEAFARLLKSSRQ
jgi:diguanylate cyclase (GGDEF)-like protein/PAS domain S-box-containing protein